MGVAYKKGVSPNFACSSCGTHIHLVSLYLFQNHTITDHQVSVGLGWHGSSAMLLVCGDSAIGYIVDTITFEVQSLGCCEAQTALQPR